MEAENERGLKIAQCHIGSEQQSQDSNLVHLALRLLLSSTRPAASANILDSKLLLFLKLLLDLSPCPSNCNSIHCLSEYWAK